MIAICRNSPDENRYPTPRIAAAICIKSSNGEGATPANIYWLDDMISIYFNEKDVKMISL